MGIIYLYILLDFFQEGWNTEARMERSFSDTNGGWIHTFSHGITGILIHRVYSGRNLLRCKTGGNGADGVGTFRAKILRFDI